MALTSCKECGGPVSTNASACPKCGAPPPPPPPPPKRTSLFTWLVTAVVCFILFAGITGNHDVPPAPPTASQLAPQTQDSRPYAERLKDAQAIEAKWRKELFNPKAPKTSVDDVKSAGEELLTIPKGDPAYAEAQKTKNRFLEDAAKQAAIDGPKLRKEFAAEAQHEFLMKGMDATFAAEGPSATTLHFRYVLAGAPLAEQLKTDGTFIARCQSAGFKKLILDDKFGKTWTFTLSR